MQEMLFTKDNGEMVFDGVKVDATSLIHMGAAGYMKETSYR